MNKYCLSIDICITVINVYYLLTNTNNKVSELTVYSMITK